MTKANINWTWKRYEEFSGPEFYGLLAARIDVFVVEQRCAYQELDGRDIDAYHLCGSRETGLAAYLRLLPPGNPHAEPSIGRVMIVAAARGDGLGRELMTRGIQGCRQFYPGQALRVSAQAHLESFYESLGFVTVGSRYEEDGIPHVDMSLKP
jgi:ElaA protein